MVQDLPHRAAGWNVRGQRLATAPSGGNGGDVIVDWIAGPDQLLVSEGHRPLNRLMGFSARGELPAFVLYATPKSSSAFTVPPPGGGGGEATLHHVLDIVASRDDLRAKFRCGISVTDMLIIKRFNLFLSFIYFTVTTSVTWK